MSHVTRTNMPCYTFESATSRHLQVEWRDKSNYTFRALGTILWGIFPAHSQCSYMSNIHTLYFTHEGHVLVSPWQVPSVFGMTHFYK